MMTSSLPEPVGRPPTEVHGLDLDPQTRCRHWHSPVDIVAIQMKCCDTYYACAECHAALADHPLAVWPRDEWHRTAILCGACRHAMTIADYMASADLCAACGAGFNPECRTHHHLYFSGVTT